MRSIVCLLLAGFLSQTAIGLRPVVSGISTNRQQVKVFSKQPSKRRKRRKAAAPAAPPPMSKTDDSNSTASLIVDEPGKLVGGSLSDMVKEKRQVKEEEETAELVETLKKGIDDRFGKRPEDASDAFDYGLGNLVKQTVYIFAAALVLFDIYINSPFFERALPSPVVTAISQELEKNDQAAADKVSAPPPLDTDNFLSAS